MSTAHEFPTAIDLCSGCGAASYGLQCVGYNVRAAFEIDPAAAYTYQVHIADHDDMAVYGHDITDVRPEMVTQIDGGEDLDLVFAGPPCLLPDEPILTQSGYRRIAEILPGERVLTHEGRNQPVTDVGRKPYEGDLVEINMLYRPDPLKLTPEHPVLTDRGWVEAGNLSEKDSMAFPKRSKSTSPGTFQYEHGLNQHAFETRTLDTDFPRFWELVGLYLAEGWRRKDRSIVNFGIHQDELDNVRELINDVFPNRSVRIEENEGKGIKAKVKHKGLWRFLEQFGESAKEKSLPPKFEVLEAEYAEALLTGYMNGDGHNNDLTVAYTTASRELAEGIQRLWLHTHGVVPSIEEKDNRGRL